MELQRAINIGHKSTLKSHCLGPYNESMGIRGSRFLPDDLRQLRLSRYSSNNSVVGLRAQI